MRISDWSSDVCSSDLVGVGEDAVQPRLEVRSLREGAPRGEGLHEGLLHEVGRVGGIARHTHRRRVQLIHEWESLLLELRARVDSGIGLDVHHAPVYVRPRRIDRSEEHTSELQSLMRISYAVFCLKKKNKTPKPTTYIH